MSHGLVYYLHQTVAHREKKFKSKLSLRIWAPEIRKFWFPAAYIWSKEAKEASGTKVIDVIKRADNVLVTIFRLSLELTLRLIFNHV